MNKLLTINEVAKKLEVSRSLVAAMLREGKLKGIKVGERNWRVNPSDVNDFIEKNSNVDDIENIKRQLHSYRGRRTVKKKKVKYDYTSEILVFLLGFTWGLLLGILFL